MWFVSYGYGGFAVLSYGYGCKLFPIHVVGRHKMSSTKGSGKLSSS